MPDIESKDQLTSFFCSFLENGGGSGRQMYEYFNQVAGWCFFNVYFYGSVFSDNEFIVFG